MRNSKAALTVVNDENTRVPYFRVCRAGELVVVVTCDQALRDNSVTRPTVAQHFTRWVCRGSRGSIALLLLVPLTVACAGPSLQQRRAHWDTPGQTISDQQFLADESACNERAESKSRGLVISGAVLNGLGVIAWSLLVPGIALSIAAGTTAGGTKKSCTSQRGYEPKTPDAEPPACHDAADAQDASR